jgi:hypothetical protein
MAMDGTIAKLRVEGKTGLVASPYERAVIVVVGDSAVIENDVRALGPVRVVDPTGHLLRELAERR